MTTVKRRIPHNRYQDLQSIQMFFEYVIKFSANLQYCIQLSLQDIQSVTARFCKRNWQFRSIQRPDNNLSRPCSGTSVLYALLTIQPVVNMLENPLYHRPGTLTERMMITTPLKEYQDLKKIEKSPTTNLSRQRLTSAEVETTSHKLL